MDNKVSIQSVHVRNFRSIRNEYIDAKNLNILVGLNDVGKSNFLKALNLFFNGDTDYATTFDFSKDFSYLFPKSSHKTKEIVIEIKFNIPDTYKDKGEYTWKKVWRANNYTDESILNVNGEKPSQRSRVPGTLKRIKYRYVPAIKSKEYYKTLLSELYLTAASALNSPLEESTKRFSQVIQEYTEQIHQEVHQRVGIDSKLTIPENLSEMFKTLIFKTSNVDSNVVIPLEMRGDGIQVRHIPIILKYIANQDQKTRNKGSMKITTIWGFEEPENGVELSKAFEMAKEFSEYSEDIQIFLTTHSPAFYMQKDNSKCQVAFVTKNKEGTNISLESNKNYIGEVMGLMPIVAPYIAEQEKILENANMLLKNNILYDVPTILVEGKTDKLYLELAIKLFNSHLNDLIENNQLRIFTKEGEGGCKNLINLAYAWIYSGNKSRAIVLFDKDKAGRIAKEELVSSDIFKGKKGTSVVQVKYLEPSEEILNLMKKRIDVFYEIEHLLSVDFWKKMKVNNWVEPRSNEELFEMIKAVMDRSKPIDSILDEKISDYDLLHTIVTFNPHKNKKEVIFHLIERSGLEEQKQYLGGLKKTVDMLSRIFLESSKGGKD